LETDGRSVEKLSTWGEMLACRVGGEAVGGRVVAAVFLLGAAAARQRGLAGEAAAAEAVQVDFRAPQHEEQDGVVA